MLPIVFLFLNAILIIEEAKAFFPLSQNDTLRIVGGSHIEITEAPYQVSLQVNGGHFCGGSLIAQSIVLTAAHCISSSNFQVRVGTSYYAQGGQVYSVRKVLTHPRYSSSHFDCDVAIVWLSKPVTTSDKVKVISMKSSGEEVRDGDPVEVSGWGDTVPKITLASEKLKKVIINKVSHEACSQAYQNINRITNNMLCAGVPQGGQNACHGDSGGPLVHDGKLAGVVSFGIGCARPQYPAVYAKVSALRNWIDENINKGL